MQGSTLLTMTDSKKYICNNCLSVNELDLTHLIESTNKPIEASEIPMCGDCQQAIYNGQAITLNDKNFANVIGKSNLPIIVDFWSIGCGPCKAMLPAYAKASAALFPNVILAKLNIETAPQVTEKYDIRGLPTFILFKQGKSVIRKVGAMTTEQIIEWIESVI